VEGLQRTRPGEECAAVCACPYLCSCCPLCLFRAGSSGVLMAAGWAVRPRLGWAWAVGLCCARHGGATYSTATGKRQHDDRGSKQDSTTVRQRSARGLRATSTTSLNVVVIENRHWDSKQENKRQQNGLKHDTRGVGKKQMEDRKKSRRVGEGGRKGKRKQRQ
jgi:hypothetical protein